MAALLPPTEHLPKLDNTFGAALIGGVCAAILFGITSMQTLSYYDRYTRDPLHIKLLVAFMWLCDGLQIAFILHMLYHYMVTNAFNPLAINIPTWSVAAMIAVSNISDTAVRAFFAHKIWILSHGNWVLVLVTVILSIVVCVSGLGFGIRSFFFSTFAGYDQLRWVLYEGFSVSLVTDFWIAGCLCLLLNSVRTGFKKTDSLVNFLLLYCVTTGVLTAICQLAVLVTFITTPHNFIFIGIYFNLSKFYCNSLLASLNIRDRLRTKNSNTVSFKLSTKQSVPPSPLSPTSAYARDEVFRNLTVNVQTETETAVSSSYRGDGASEKFGYAYSTNETELDIPRVTV